MFFQFRCARRVQCHQECGEPSVIEETEQGGDMVPYMEREAVNSSAMVVRGLELT